MHYLYIGYYVDDQVFNQILKQKINNMSAARQKFEYNLIRGLHSKLGDAVTFISYVPTKASFVIPEESWLDGARIRHIPIEKKSVRSIAVARRNFEKLLHQLGENWLHDLRVIMYAVNPVFEMVLLKYRKRYGIKLITLCSEVPGLRRYGSSILSRVKKSVLTYFNEQFDGYVFFSAEMQKVVKYHDKMNIVMEGIAQDIVKAPVAGKRNIVMYAGGLAPDNNIPLLLSCCKEIPFVDAVWICGDGPDREQIEMLAADDPKVTYWGRLPNEDVMKLEEQAKILVNLRSPIAELTRYSFPSKLLEYISAGCLVLSTRLGGIPGEYFRYIIEVDSAEKSQIIERISWALALTDQEYVQKCEAAQVFIQKEKNYLKQSERIIELAAQI